MLTLENNGRNGFLLNKTIANNDINSIYSPCKIEGRDYTCDNKFEDIVQEPYNMPIEFESVLSLAKAVYDYILREGWKNTVMDNNQYSDYQNCQCCCNSIDVLEYSSSATTLENGVDIEMTNLLSSSNLICGYFNCHCWYHLQCVLNNVCNSLCKQLWRCDYHQIANAFFV